MDRYQLVIDVLDRVPGLGVRTVTLREQLQDQRQRHHAWIREHGEDLPEVRHWRWPGATEKSWVDGVENPDSAGPSHPGRGLPAEVF